MARRWAQHAGFVDRPARRKAHLRPMPLGGGLAIAAGVVAGGTAGIVAQGPDALVLAFGSRFAAAVLGGLVLSVALGLRDDRSSIPPAAKLAGQAAAAALLILGSGRPDPGALGGLAVPVALFLTVAVMNACNFLDNMDGVLSGIVFVCGCALAVSASAPAADHSLAVPAAVAASATAGAAAGFLAHNFPPARIFMGDAGSLALGFLLAATALAVVPPALPAAPGLGLLFILGYPLFDLTFVTVTRILDGRKVWTPGQDHTSHRLNRVLRSARRTALVVYGFTAIAASAGVVLCRWPGPVSALFAVAGGVALLGLGVGLARVPRAA